MGKPSKRDIEKEINDRSTVSDDPAELWRRFITGQFPEDPNALHPQINRWLAVAMDDQGYVHGGFDAPKWAIEIDGDELVNPDQD